MSPETTQIRKEIANDDEFREAVLALAARLPDEDLAALKQVLEWLAYDCPKDYKLTVDELVGMVERIKRANQTTDGIALAWGKWAQ